MKKSLKKKTRSKRVVRNRTKRVYNNRLKVGGMDAGDDENHRGKKTPRRNEQPRLVRLHDDELKKPDSKRRKKYEPPPLAGQKRAPDDDEEQVSKRPKTTEKALEDAVEQAHLDHVDAAVFRADAEAARVEAEASRVEAEGARAEAVRANAEAARADVEIESFRCPITQAIMEDPVICSDGHSYEREAIERWFHRSDRSPATNEQLPNTNLIPNHNLKQAIAEWRQQQR